MQIGGPQRRFLPWEESDRGEVWDGMGWDDLMEELGKCISTGITYYSTYIQYHNTLDVL